MGEPGNEAAYPSDTKPVGSALERQAVLWLTNASHGVNHFQTQMVAVLYETIMPALGFGYAQLGLLQAVQSVLSDATQGLYGFVTPFLKHTWLLGIGNVVLRLGALATGFVNSFSGFLGTRSLASVGASAQHPVGYSLLAGYFPTTQGKIIGLNTSTAGVGGLLAPITATGMLLIMGWRQIFVVVSLLSIAIGLAYFLFKPRNEAVKGEGSTSRAKLIQSKDSYLRVFRSRNMILISLVMMVGGAGRGGGGNMAFLAVHFTNDLALSTFLVGVGITAVAIGGVAGPFGLGWLSDRSSRTGVLQGSLLASALSTFWLAFQGAFLPLLLLNLVLYGVATRSRVSLTQVLVVDSLADADRDAAFSVFFFLGFASGPFWSLTVGLLMETVGFEVAFSVLGVSYLIGMLLMLFVVDPRRAQR